MRIKILIIALLGFTLASKAQTISVEKSEWQLQLGTFGGWINNESKLSKSLALRCEFGLDAGWRSYGDQTDLALTPVIRIEPRWYYNFGNRINNSKRIDGNSGNYMGLKTSFNPEWFVISNNEYLTVDNQISIVPVWGIRRSLGARFNFEAGVGLGYRYIFPNNIKHTEGEGQAALDLNLRFGYQL